MSAELSAQLETLAQGLRASTVRVHDERGRGSGSGLVWNAEGLVITNAHVVRGRRATIEFGKGEQVAADVVKRDDARDLAALRLATRAGTALPKGLAAAAVRDSATLVPGELVVAVGNPLGFVGAVTAGLVQRCNARWVVADVRLAPGNSGGPLADTAGRVVGINSMVAGGLALAVPSAAVRAFLGVAAPRRRLGLQLAPVSAQAGARRIPALLVTGVEARSAAERAGLLLGDAIVGADGAPLRDAERFAAAIGAGAALDVLRAGRSLRIVVPPADPGEPGRTPEDSRAA
jgi:serine protease Do